MIPFDIDDAVTPLEKAIASAHLTLQDHNPTSDEYAAIVKQLTELYKLHKLEGELYLAQQADARRDLESEVERRQKITDINKTNADMRRDAETLPVDLDNTRADSRLKNAEANAQEKENSRKWRVSQDVAMTAAANIVAILVIVGYERGHVLTSKALSFIGKSR